MWNRESLARDYANYKNDLHSGIQWISDIPILS